VQPGNLEAAVGAGAGLAYLRVRPAVAAARLGEDSTRPLLAGGDRAARLETLFAEREAWYRKADYELDAEGTVEETAAKVAEAAAQG
jgi:shikimate kinase